MNEATTPGSSASGGTAPRGLLGRLDDTGVPTLIARLIVGVVFIHHGLVKVGDTHAFLKAVKGYGILPLDPPFLLNSVAVVLPWVEVVIGLLLVLGHARRAGGLLSFILLVVFTASIGKLTLDYMALHPEQAFLTIELDCGCGAGATNVAKKFAENAGLIVLSAWLMLSRSRRFKIPILTGG